MSDAFKDILSSADGVVEEVGKDETLGKYISIEHVDGSKTLYATLGEIGVSKDEKVKQGQVIGAIGVSGASTVEHVHFVIADKDRIILTNTSKY